MAGPLIVTYHAISDAPNLLAVSVEMLREQLRWFLRRGYRPVRFLDAVLRAPTDKSLAVTFDDGFRSVYELARPVLDELGLPATAFVVSDQVGSNRPLSWPGFQPHPMSDDELLPMTWDQVRELSSSGWEIGSHTLTHPRLPQVVDDAVLRRELAESKAAVEHQLGVPCLSLAYPFGETDARVARLTAEVGYRAAATMCRVRGGSLAMPRVGLYADDHRPRLTLKVSRPLLTDAAGLTISALQRFR